MTTQTKTISTGYDPREFQAEIHKKLKRFNVIVCHRRFGKSVLCINEIIDKALRNENKNPQYAYIAPFFGQAKRVAWQYFKDFTSSIPGVTYNEAELRVNIKREPFGDAIRIWLLGAENPAALKGIYLDGCVLDEYAEMDPSLWGEIIRPTLSDRLGWAIFIGTPKGQNHFYDLYEKSKTMHDWWSVIYKGSSTGVLSEAEIEDLKKEMSREEYLQEIECSFSAAIKGAYYGNQIEDAESENRINNDVKWDRNLKVSTYWDLGMKDTTVIWFVQMYKQEVRLIDFVEANGKDLPYYAAEVNNRPYVYDVHTLPHDAAARSLETGRSRQEALARLLRGRVEVQKRHFIKDGIEAVRMLLPRCYFNKTKCHQGLLALKAYTQRYDSKKKTFIDRPLHNWASNAADGMRCLAMGLKEERIDYTKLPRRTNNEYNIFDI